MMSERITNIRRTITIEGEQEDQPPSGLEERGQRVWLLALPTWTLLVVLGVLAILAMFR